MLKKNKNIVASDFPHKNTMHYCESIINRVVVKNYDGIY